MHNEYGCVSKTLMHIVFTHTGFQTYGWVQLLEYMIHLHLLYLVKYTCWETWAHLLLVKTSCSLKMQSNSHCNSINSMRLRLCVNKNRLIKHLDQWHVWVSSSWHGDQGRDQVLAVLWIETARQGMAEAGSDMVQCHRGQPFVWSLV